MTSARPEITSADVRAAAQALDGVAHRTPVLTSHLLDAELGCEVHLKAENLQRMGAFKFRGAFWALENLPEGDGVVAYSSGNHAQAIALAARIQGREAVIVMPSDAPRSKAEATRGYGAQIVTYDRYTEDRSAIAATLAAERGAHVIPPFDHPRIIAGQGTAALELFEDVGELDALFVPCGGGGLLAGSLLATADASPDCTVIGVEPAAGDDVTRSVAAGHPIAIDVPRTIADGAQTARVGDLTFPIIRDRGAEMTTVPDERLVEEMRMLALRLKTVVEPTGCLGLAGLRSHAERWRGARVGVILSGGNVDLDRYTGLLSGTVVA
ncbi:threo-3-hydroxy-L-aspartate ammonia-lyase [Brachybacterium huguangmaarense]|uniref:Threo-3-hydroxy-L-aspartate ammonia-lyase n=1 Tax=Brachybacterium huguangmaarense TaxID=1652028 RepID=A0ABY6G0B5_9MICO|nr:threo-3-hydroxy-L-aspartate ammonia-lyase [Brachybacterium huguangmaarense]UYG16114.1 threo-3-hydroxy-L-aspartate ammonia-lyase [Brachybacterium huguangmaarense]